MSTKAQIQEKFGIINKTKENSIAIGVPGAGKMKRELAISLLICSNCGSKISILKKGHEKELMVIENWGKLGDAYYCKRCISTWKDRNNGTFEECGGVRS